MYWYKPALKTAIVLSGVILMAGIASCKKDSNAARDTLKFFDIKGYFKADSARLSRLNPLVNKTVVHNKHFADQTSTHFRTGAPN